MVHTSLIYYPCKSVTTDFSEIISRILSTCLTPHDWEFALSCSFSPPLSRPPESPLRARATAANSLGRYPQFMRGNQSLEPSDKRGLPPFIPSDERIRGAFNLTSLLFDKLPTASDTRWRCCGLRKARTNALSCISKSTHEISDLAVISN